MTPLLLLVDLQNDFLSAAGLEPAPGEIVRRAAWLLEQARAHRWPVAHAVTSVDPRADTRMPHWKARGVWKCVRGTEGAAPPASLLPAAGEPVVEKTFFSAFSTPGLDRAITSARADTLLVAGIHLHGCVRATVLDAYARGLEVWVAEDAVGSDDPLHGAVTRRYLEDRAAWFALASELVRRLEEAPPAVAGPVVLPSAVIAGVEVSGRRGAVCRSPRDRREALFSVGEGQPAEASAAVDAARAAQALWAGTMPAERLSRLRRLADALERDADAFAHELATDIGKPVAEGRAEVLRAAEILRGAPASDEAGGTPSGWRRVALGVVAAITPWNNPVAIPIGKIAPALALGNAVVWKPSPAGTRLALRVLALARESGLPAGLLNLLSGGRAAAALLMALADGVSLSGSSASGWSAQEICARRRIPLQAELGGNNASVVWQGEDLPHTASLVARGAFSFAGQRCTANRRVIAPEPLVEAFRIAVTEAAAALVWGDPLDPATEIGPMISDDARDRFASAVERARREGDAVVAARDVGDLPPALGAHGAYAPPTIVVSRRPSSEIVQEETFGPALVIQPARDLAHALALANGVRQGLVASFFGERDLWDRFRDGVEAGIVKRGLSTAGADAAAPFGGWKASGVGPPERGPGDVAFFTRVQTISEAR